MVGVAAVHVLGNGSDPGLHSGSPAPKYFAGVVPRARRNMLMKALGVSYPTAIAAWVTLWPEPSRRSASSSRA